MLSASLCGTASAEGREPVQPVEAEPGPADPGAPVLGDVLAIEDPDASIEPLVIVEHENPAVQATTIEVEVEVESQPVRPQRPGTHMVLELNAGAALGDTVGEAGGALFGLGGKPVGFPWRFYFIGEIGQTHVRDAGLLAHGMFAADRRYWDMAVGLRIYVPLWGPVRVFGDATLGGAFVSSTLIRPDLAPLEADDWYVMGAFAAGIQARILHELSIGLRAKVMLADDGLSELRDTLDIDGTVPTTVTGGVTWHI